MELNGFQDIFRHSCAVTVELYQAKRRRLTCVYVDSAGRPRGWPLSRRLGAVHSSPCPGPRRGVAGIVLEDRGLLADRVGGVQVHVGQGGQEGSRRVRSGLVFASREGRGALLCKYLAGLGGEELEYLADCIYRQFMRASEVQLDNMQ
jgi:hypothetical protein